MVKRSILIGSLSGPNKRTAKMDRSRTGSTDLSFWKDLQKKTFFM